MSASRNYFELFRNHSLFLVLLVIGAVLRFYNFSSWSLSNDELSAIYRAKLSNPTGWIGTGEAIDGHPIGIQVFLYVWIKIFGDSAFAVRLPFVIAGIVSLILAYRVALLWFGRTTALFTTLCMAFSGYFILYSQLARPYSPGLMCSLFLVYCWSKIVMDDLASTPNKYFIGFVISLMCCMYIHYFSFLFAAIIGLLGLFYIQKRNITKYLLTGVFAVLAFFPHWGFTQTQLSIGGLHWLAKPDSDALLTYISNGLNDSDFMILPLCFTFLYGLIFCYKDWKFGKSHFLAVTLFLLPFIICYYYSIYKLPVLQYSVLIFSFPFFLMYAFSYLKQKQDVTFYGLFVFLGITSAYSLIADNNFYNRQYFGVFRELAQKNIEWNNEFGEKNITSTININHPEYINYYLRRENKSIPYAMYSVNSGEDLGKLYKLVQQSNTSFFLHAWSTVDNLPETEQIIRSKYPKVKKQEKYFNSAITLYSKETDTSSIFYTSLYDFEKTGILDHDSEMLSTQFSRSGRNSIMLNDEREYAPTVVKRLSQVKPRTDSARIEASVWMYAPEINTDAEFVISFESLNSTYDWHSQRLNYFVTEKNKWIQVFVARRIPRLPSTEDVIKIYVWNPGKKQFYIDDLEVKVIESN